MVKVSEVMVKFLRLWSSYGQVSEVMVKFLRLWSLVSEVMVKLWSSF